MQVSACGSVLRRHKRICTALHAVHAQRVVMSLRLVMRCCFKWTVYNSRFEQLQ